MSVISDKQNCFKQHAKTKLIEFGHFKYVRPFLFKQVVLGHNKLQNITDFLPKSKLPPICDIRAKINSTFWQKVNLQRISLKRH